MSSSPKRFKSDSMASQYDYDYIVIGGGSGGMASAKEAARLGAKVALFDYVKPSTQGTTWGLGGTCVNVGCVPKKLMHYSGLLGGNLEAARKYGWKLPEHTEHDWEKLVETVQDHIGMLNFSYRKGVQKYYINALAKFVDPHTITYVPKGKKEAVTVTAANILISVGGRPHVPEEVPGAVELAITSDDIFKLPHPPGKTLCVGGSYIALECAGFLNELGYDVTVNARSILLRGFDRQCAEKVGSVMAELGTKFLYGVSPTALRKLDDGKIEVTFGTGDKLTKDVFDTVLFATGRYPDVKGLNLEASGVQTLPNGKIPVKDEQTNVPHIYAIGDVIPTRQELTPVAIKTGEMLARRLFGGSKQVLDYHFVPTTVFTPIEYGTVGYSEEEAIAKYGAENIETYLSEFQELETAAAHKQKHPRAITDPDDADLQPASLSKLVCLKTDDQRVIGFHFVGPNAGEVTQGFALALKLGARKADFDDMVGIHPTNAESFADLSITRSSGLDFRAAGGCGGGKCG
eukprot:TRINITY_DN14864_c0_g1_i1.p1 TRINITY_DN14864_c0_g1~~TRINITY_DN14864_c0_g1_i1.p1  ORF type:complete len:517 (-),score=185.79 TRINITY_DN14864_c0_g1_i1:326-1876(-)